jgi:hypothetical protein
MKNNVYRPNPYTIKKMKGSLLFPRRTFKFPVWAIM